MDGEQRLVQLGRLPHVAGELRGLGVNPVNLLALAVVAPRSETPPPPTHTHTHTVEPGCCTPSVSQAQRATTPAARRIAFRSTYCLVVRVLIARVDGVGQLGGRRGVCPGKLCTRRGHPPRVLSVRTCGERVISGHPAGVCVCARIRDSLLSMTSCSCRLTASGPVKLSSCRARAGTRRRGVGVHRGQELRRGGRAVCDRAARRTTTVRYSSSSMSPTRASMDTVSPTRL